MRAVLREIVARAGPSELLVLLGEQRAVELQHHRVAELVQRATAVDDRDVVHRRFEVVPVERLLRVADGDVHILGLRDGLEALRLAQAISSSAFSSGRLT